MSLIVIISAVPWSARGTAARVTASLRVSNDRGGLGLVEPAAQRLGASEVPRIALRPTIERTLDSLQHSPGVVESPLGQDRFDEVQAGGDIRGAKRQGSGQRFVRFIRPPQPVKNRRTGIQNVGLLRL